MLAPTETNLGVYSTVRQTIGVKENNMEPCPRLCRMSVDLLGRFA